MFEILKRIKLKFFLIFLFSILNVSSFGFSSNFRNKSELNCLAMQSIFKEQYVNVMQVFSKNKIDVMKILTPKDEALSLQYLSKLRMILNEAGIDDTVIHDFFVEIKNRRDANLDDEAKRVLASKILTLENELSFFQTNTQELIDFIIARDEADILASEKIDFLMMFGCPDPYIPRRAVKLFKDKGCRMLVIAGGVGNGSLGLYSQIDEDVFMAVERRTGKKRFVKDAFNSFRRGILKSDIEEADRRYFGEQFLDELCPDYFILFDDKMPEEVGNKYDKKIKPAFSNTRMIRQYISEGDIYLELTLRELKKIGYTDEQVLIIDEKNATDAEVQMRMNRILDKKENGIVIFFDPLSAHTGWNIIFSKEVIKRAGALERFDSYKGVLLQWALIQKRTYATFIKHFKSTSVLNYAVKVNYDELSLREKDALFYGQPSILGVLQQLKDMCPGTLDDVVTKTKFYRLIQYLKDKDVLQKKAAAAKLLLVSSQLDVLANSIYSLYSSIVDIKKQLLNELHIKMFDNMTSAL